MDKQQLLKKLSKSGLSLPVLPLRDIVCYPHTVMPLFVGREMSIKALDVAISSNGKYIILVAQSDPTLEVPSTESLYKIGVIANILQMLKLPDGTVKVLIEGIHRVGLLSCNDVDGYFLADVVDMPGEPVVIAEYEVLSRTLLSQFEKYIKLNKRIPQEILASVANMHDLERITYTIAANITLKITERQKLLETLNLKNRVELLIMLMEAEFSLLELEHNIRNNVKNQIEKNQKEHYLHEQMRAIQNELGVNANEIEVLTAKINASGMTTEAKDKAEAELKKMQMMSPLSAEAAVSRNYLDYLINVPWKESTKSKFTLEEAQIILDADHYGLEKIKERIVEYLAVQKRVKTLKGPILCLVGPPGVGKTSLGQSIARATGRKFVRFALGGVRDEAEIRGHRRTYIGAMPGKIIQKITKSKVKNPLFLLDEIDKMAMDFRGDPAAALLEVLDPEQNSTFNDNYLEVDYDLSDVMFVATANSLNIPPALLDRMEIIYLSGYTDDEKVSIAQKYLLPKQMKLNGLEFSELALTQKAILDIAHFYTREAGVRNLEREISQICRKVVKEILTAEVIALKPEIADLDLMDDKNLAKKKIKTKTKTKINKAEKITTTVDREQLEHYLGVVKYRFGEAPDSNKIGQVTGLAWTEAGGDILSLEVVVVPGSGKIITTGKLGDVMKESIQAALSVVRSRAISLGIAENFYEKNDVHVHVPEGATPKDGPSAGIGMYCAIVSALTKIPVHASIAMTGEITLRGEVLAIGGLKEKLLAAKRAGIKEVIIPKENEYKLKELPDNIKQGLVIHLVRWIDEALEIVLTQRPIALGSVTDNSPITNLTKQASTSKIIDDPKH